MPRTHNRDLVVQSLESTCGTRCVDILMRRDGVFCLAEFRRDPEDPRGWAEVVRLSECYGGEGEALAAARRLYDWVR